MKQNIKRALNLVDELLKMAVMQDEEHRKQALKEHKGSQAIGNSFMVFHLRKLKQLLSEEGSKDDGRI